MRTTLLLILTAFAFNLSAQTSYSGFLDKYPITLVALHYGEGSTQAYYAYDKYDTPIRIDGVQEGATLRFFEMNEKEEITATFEFTDFNENAETLKGSWTSSDGRKSYNVSLNRDIDIDAGIGSHLKQPELLQFGSTNDHYFKTILGTENGEFPGWIIGVNIYEKQTDRLIQSIELECELSGIDNVTLGDFNFDNFQDFSVFKESFSGPNTTSYYILRDPKSEQYFMSDIDGISLQFDYETKTILETNSCCAGTSINNTTYKVIDNQLVLIRMQCLEYNHDTEEFDDVECEE